MSDENATTTEETAPVSAPESNPVVESIELPGIAVADNALIGDEAVQSAYEAPEAHVVQEDVPAQTTGDSGSPVEVSKVHETTIILDKVVTDPHSPEAVQIPDAGRGTLDLPLHALAGKSPEQVFADSAKD
jgi:hypothetical protein